MGAAKQQHQVFPGSVVGWGCRGSNLFHYTCTASVLREHVADYEGMLTQSLQGLIQTQFLLQG